MAATPASSASLHLSTSAQGLLSSYLELLVAGNRNPTRELIDAALTNGHAPQNLLGDLIWPAMETLQARFKNDVINTTQLNLATRLNRFVADYLGARLEKAPANGKRVLVFCGNAEPEELGGQVTSDLFEAAGYEVKFAGGGVPDDEVLKLIGEFRPELLVMFATLPSGIPGVRKLIDYLREVNSNPDMQILCCGGIYKRAEGLAEEIGADLYAPDGMAAVELALDFPGRRATLEQQTVGRARRSKKAATVRRGPILGRIAPVTAQAM